MIKMPMASKKASFFSKGSVPFILAILAASLIGFSPILVRFSAIGPTATGFFRFFLALPFLAIWMVVDDLKGERQLYKKKKTDYALLLVSGIWLGLDIAFWHWALQKTTVVNATLLNNLTVVFIALFSWIILREKTNLRNVVGISLALLGAILLVGSEFRLNTETLWGDLLALHSALFYAGYVLCIKRLRSVFRTPTIMTWSCFSTIYTLFILLLLVDEPILPTSGMDFIPLIALSIFVHVLGQGVMAYTMGHLTASFSALTMMVCPIVSTLLAWIIFDETLTPLKMVGGVIILGGIIIARQNEKKNLKIH